MDHGLLSVATLQWFGKSRTTLFSLCALYDTDFSCLCIFIYIFPDLHLVSLSFTLQICSAVGLYSIIFKRIPADLFLHSFIICLFFNNNKSMSCVAL